MKAFVTGVAGQLGYDIVRELEKRKISYVGSDVKALDDMANGGWNKDTYIALDITDEAAVQQVILQVKPDVVFHCAAWTAVDAAEEEENQAIVKKVNEEGTQNIAKACQQTGAKMVYISTDYVFDGQGETPWEADCKEYAPLNVYGASKLAGELVVSELLEKYFIVRIAWVFGQNGNNFIKTMLRLGQSHKELRVVCDQIGTPTYTYDLARLLVDMAQTEKYGYYHATNEGGYISWYEFAKEIFEQAVELGHAEYKDVTVQPVTTAEYGVSKAARPFNSRLQKDKLKQQGFTQLPTWQDALKRYLGGLSWDRLQ